MGESWQEVIEKSLSVTMNIEQCVQLSSGLACFGAGATIKKQDLEQVLRLLADAKPLHLV